MLKLLHSIRNAKYVKYPIISLYDCANKKKKVLMVFFTQFKIFIGC